MRSLQLLWHDFIDLIFPQACLACGGVLVESERLICTGCLISIPKTNSHQQAVPSLNNKFAGKIPIEHVLSYFTFEKSSRVQNLLHHLKYKNQPELGVLLGKSYGTNLREIGLHGKLDLIVSVPLHKDKQKQRGYNQSDCFAEGLSEALAVPWSGVALRRVVKTDTQTKKNRTERWQNVGGVFEIGQPNDVAGKRVALVDDVMTTGATIESAAITLLNAGCRQVSVITIAAAM